MAKKYSIAQWLYIHKSSLQDNSLTANKVAEIVGEDIKFELLSSDNETIESQYEKYKSQLTLITNSISTRASGAAVLSISVKVYEYMPEIALSADLLSVLSSIRASIDIDVIDMRDE